MKQICVCGKEHKVAMSRIVKGWSKYCCLSCRKIHTRNQFKHNHDGTTNIYLKNGMVVLVDTMNYDKVKLYKWGVAQRGRACYATASIDGTRQYMHRIILNPGSLDVDHANGNGLDNRVSNIRICTTAENVANRHYSPKNTSGHKGVSWDKRNNLWRAYIVTSNKQKHLGYFIDKNVAALAYNAAAIKYFGEYARLNDVD